MLALLIRHAAPNGKSFRLTVFGLLFLLVYFFVYPLSAFRFPFSSLPVCLSTKQSSDKKLADNNILPAQSLCLPPCPPALINYNLLCSYWRYCQLTVYWKIQTKRGYWGAKDSAESSRGVLQFHLCNCLRTLLISHVNRCQHSWHYQNLIKMQINNKLKWFDICLNFKLIKLHSRCAAYFESNAWH